MVPRVSICIPTFNRKDYLAQTLASVYSQTYTNYEVIVVDDGSTDATGDFIRQAQYDRMRYYWQKNAGDAAARNKLIGLAQGEFITFIDSDDLLLPDSVERMVEAMDSASDDVIVYGPYLRIDEHGTVCGRSKRKILRSGYITKYLFQDIQVHSCGSMFPRKALVKAGGFDESLKVCSDYDLWLRLSLEYRFIAIPDPTFKRRRHSENLSTICAKNQIKELEVLERFYYENRQNVDMARRVAMRRLSKEEYRVGKYFLRERNFEMSACYFQKSFFRHPGVKALFMWVLSSLKQKLPRIQQQKIY